MPSTRELRGHIRSIKSTRQITKAMEMVASSKMRRATAAMMATRPYADRALDIVRDLSGGTDRLSHPLLAPRPVKTAALLVISSDRGLAGPYNAQITRAAVEFIRAREKLGQKVRVFTIGTRAATALAKFGHKTEQSYPHVADKLQPADAVTVSRFLTAEFTGNLVDEVSILSTTYVTALVQRVAIEPLIPLSAPPPEGAKASMVFYEPAPETVLAAILPRLIEARVFQAMQESLASEHAARRTAMQSASDNAEKIVDTLQLEYNGVRQGNITREISEITSGAAAL
jgi:F-type H+-transporting ATPase subunit gamma